MDDINKQFQSPNFGERRGGQINLIVLHYTAMENAALAVARLCDPKSEVSAHYVISQSGEIFQLVDEDKRAWHAGVAHWDGEDDVNSCSIGIELDHMGMDAQGQFLAYPAAQIERLITLLQDLCARYHIPPHRVVGHSDVAPLRKQDPGDLFPWQELAAAGVGIWPQGAEEARALQAIDAAGAQACQIGDRGAHIGVVQRVLRQIGYGLAIDDIYGPHTAACVTSFQRRFRSERSDGDVDHETLGQMLRVRDYIASVPGAGGH